ncbi:PLP-dependent aminotransferase family protein [Leeia sp. TBRC 13508]|uniref:Putative 8-amino-7-oxononanoate synthase n=1 Tax=Leeia speluncae TaxID=2884804 RepID=A0ABS8D806_9NEIS|nr:PLP-dependent aminotransferase family protein [Leeia speluncae]MCB6184168.1 PLP-dependent aminotransferase family protein [Leeia speluncae]
MNKSLLPLLDLNPESNESLVSQIVNGLSNRISNRQLRPGSKAPSIRQFAQAHGISTFTVVEAYDRLVAKGFLQPRRGAGFFVADSAPKTDPVKPRLNESNVDSYWLLRNVYENAESGIHAGCGWLPTTWLDEEALQKGLRQAARSTDRIVKYGHPKGYAPLRETISRHLQELEIEVGTEQVLLTLGASQALDLVTRRLTVTGDTVLVDDPGYSNLMSALRLRGLKLIGVPMTPSGPDIQALTNILATHRPKLYFTNTQLQNPTGASYSPATAYRVLQLAAQYDFKIVEDNVSSDLVPGRQQTLASMDQLKQVVYIGSFSKSIAPGLRVGFIAAEKGLLEELVYHKLVSGMATPELNETLVHGILTEGHHRKHLEQLKEKLGRAQEKTARRLEEAGFELFHEPGAGMFLWAKCKKTAIDPLILSQLAVSKDILLAPGYLFRPDQSNTPWLRFNVAYCDNDRLFQFFNEVFARDFIIT